MLCDELAIDGASASGMKVGEVIDRIKMAQKFVLGTEFAAVADALSEDYTGLVRAFEHCRLPYPQTWIEVAQADRPRFYGAPIHAPAFQVVPKRVGYLLSATRPDLSAWKAHLFWSLPTGQTSAAGMAVAFDMTRPLTGPVALPTEEEVKMRSNRVLSGILALDIGSHPGWNNASESVKLAMLRHSQPVLADYALPVPLGMPRGCWHEFFEGMCELARADWAGEPGFLLAVIGLLNARNTTQIVVPDLSRLNKARTKRGVPPLFEHKVLRIAARQVKRVYAPGEPCGDHAPMRETFRRGHFKKRRTGIFFWSPHLMGDAKRGRIEKDYRL